MREENHCTQPSDPKWQALHGEVPHLQVNSLTTRLLTSLLFYLPPKVRRQRESVLFFLHGHMSVFSSRSPPLSLPLHIPQQRHLGCAGQKWGRGTNDSSQSNSSLQKPNTRIGFWQISDASACYLNIFLVNFTPPNGSLDREMLLSNHQPPPV